MGHFRVIALAVFVFLPCSVLSGMAPACRVAVASDDSVSLAGTHRSLPPLGSAIDLLPAPRRAAAQPVPAILDKGDSADPKVVSASKAALTPEAGSSEVVPPADTPSVEDDVSDSVAEDAIMPHVEEDSAGGLVDGGDVGGDFEE